MAPRLQRIAVVLILPVASSLVGPANVAWSAPQPGADAKVVSADPGTRAPVNATEAPTPPPKVDAASGAGGTPSSAKGTAVGAEDDAGPGAAGTPSSTEAAGGAGGDAGSGAAGTPSSTEAAGGASGSGAAGTPSSTEAAGEAGGDAGSGAAGTPSSTEAAGGAAGAAGTRSSMAGTAVIAEGDAGTTEAAGGDAGSGAVGQGTAPGSQPEHPRGHGMVIGGVSLLGVGILSYVGLAVAAGIANHAHTTAGYLTEPGEEQEYADAIERRDAARGAAIGTAVAAVSLMATGLALVIVGRRRAAADLQQRQRAGRAVTMHADSRSASIVFRGRF